jgi:hypothetical protein
MIGTVSAGYRPAFEVLAWLAADRWRSQAERSRK